MWAHVGRGNHVIGKLTIAISGVRENECVLLSCGLRAGALRRSRTRDTSLALPSVREGLPSRPSREVLDERRHVTRVQSAGFARPRSADEGSIVARFDTKSVDMKSVDMKSVDTKDLDTKNVDTKNVDRDKESC